jgi:hypothetical protein
MPRFRRKPSSRRAAAPTAKWLVTGPSIAAEIKYGRRTTHLIPCKPSHHRRRFYKGQRLSVRAYVGGCSECHVTVTSAERIQLRDVDYQAVRELGYIRMDQFRVTWVEENDQAWSAKLQEEFPLNVIERFIRKENRFDSRHGHKDVWLIRFRVERAVPPRLLAERSDELYVDTAARALREEMPALSEEEWRTHIAPASRDREHARQLMLTQARSEQSVAVRVAQARSAAAAKGLDLRSEFRRYDRLVLHDRVGDAVRQLELIESRVFPARSAA